jgi:hypothetical protein
MSIIAAFKVGSWDEEPIWEGPDGARMTRAEVHQDVEGDISGTGDARWLMCYRADGTAAYTGFQRVEGTLKGREGTLVLRSDGTFDGSRATGRLEVAHATDGLAGISGTGTFEAPRGSVGTVKLQLTGVEWPTLVP